MALLTKKKILFIVGDPNFSIHNANSAIAIYVNQLMHYLRQCGNEVFICSLQDHITEAVVPTRANPSSGKVKQALKRFFPALFAYLRYIKYKRGQLQLKEQVYQFCLSHPVDLFIELPVYGSSIGAFLKSVLCKPLVLLYDSPLVVQYEEFNKAAGREKKYIANAERANVLQADLVVTYSKAVEQYVKNNYPVGAAFMQMPCIVYKEEISPAPHEGINIGFIGSFLPWHKVAELVRAFEHLCQEYNNVQLYLVGYGMEWHSVNKLVQQSAYKDRIHLTGFVSEDELTEIKKRLDIGVMPGSNWYGSPLKLFEFAQSGIAIVTAASPTINEYFTNGETALVLQEGLPVVEELARSLKTLIADRSLRVRIGANARNMMRTQLSKKTLFDQFCSNISEVTK